MENLILDKVSYHAVYDDSILDALKYAKGNGFSGIQLGIEAPHLSFEDLTVKSTDEICNYLKRNSLYIGIHAPDAGVSLFSSNKFIREGIMNYYSALFDFAEKIQAKLITIHIGSMTTFPTDTSPEMIIPSQDTNIYRNILKENIDRLLELAKDRFYICVESYKFEDALEILQDYLQKKLLYFCWDIVKAKGDLIKYFSDNIKYVKQIHLHDLGYNDKGIRRSHRVIGTGEIDFKKYFKIFKNSDIIDYCIEVRPREKAKESLEALKLLIDEING